MQEEPNEEIIREIQEELEADEELINDVGTKMHDMAKITPVMDRYHVTDSLASIDWRDGAYDFESLRHKEFEPVPQVIEGLLEAGSLTILAGAPKAGKSWLSLDMAIAVATGGVLLGDHHASQGEVLYLALEDTDRRINGRLKTMLSDIKIKNLDKATLRTVAPRWDEGGKYLISNWLLDDEIKNPKLVVIDTLIRFRPFKTIGGGYTNDSLALIPLQKLAQAAGIAIVVVHHDIKTSKGSWENAIAGSKGLTGIADAMMMLRKGDKESPGLLYATGRDIEETRLVVKFDTEIGRWIKTEGDFDEIESMKKEKVISGNDKVILEVFRRNPDAMLRASDIERETSLKSSTIRNALERLSDKGLISWVDRGIYMLSPEPAQD